MRLNTVQADVLEMLASKRVPVPVDGIHRGIRQCSRWTLARALRNLSRDGCVIEAQGGFGITMRGKTRAETGR